MEVETKQKVIDELKKLAERLGWFTEIYDGLHDEEDRRDRIEENIEQEAKKIAEKVKEIVEKYVEIEKFDFEVDRLWVSDAVYWREYVDNLHIYIVAKTELSKKEEKYDIGELMIVKFDKNKIQISLRLAEIYHEDRVEHYIDKSVEYSYRKYTYRILS